jgi:hypothetical protein
MERGDRLHEETDQPAIEGRCPLPCEHEKPGTWVRLDLIRDFAARGYCCVHGYIADDEERPVPKGAVHSPSGSAPGGAGPKPA